MAIAFDATAGGALINAASLTYTHVCSGSDRILFVASIVRTNTASGVTYNGVAMTQVGSNVSIGIDTLQVWMLVNPASGSNSVVVSNSGTSLLNATSLSYTGALQTGQPDSTFSQNDTFVNTLVISTTTVADNSWAAVFFRTAAGVSSAGALTTFRGDNTGGLAVQAYDGNQAYSPPGSWTQTVINGNFPTADHICAVMVSFSPVITAGTTVLVPTLAFMGAG